MKFGNITSSCLFKFKAEKAHSSAEVPLDTKETYFCLINLENLFDNFSENLPSDDIQLFFIVDETYYRSLLSKLLLKTGIFFI